MSIGKLGHVSVMVEPLFGFSNLEGNIFVHVKLQVDGVMTPSLTWSILVGPVSGLHSRQRI